jgi:hypothetical protein
MEKKYSLTLDNEFIQYCKLNNIEDIEGKAKEVFKQGFTILKYGVTPNIPTIKPELSSNTMIKEDEKPVIIVTPKKDLYDE